MNSTILWVVLSPMMFVGCTTQVVFYVAASSKLLLYRVCMSNVYVAKLVQLRLQIMRHIQRRIRHTAHRTITKATMIIRPKHRTALLLLLTLSLDDIWENNHIEAFSIPKRSNDIEIRSAAPHIMSRSVRTSAASLLTAVICLFAQSQPPLPQIINANNFHTIAHISSTAANAVSLDEITNSKLLKPPNENQPQIVLTPEMQAQLENQRLPTNVSGSDRVNSVDESILQGLVYIDSSTMERKGIPLNPSDYVVVTASVPDSMPPTGNEPVIMGAKVRVSKARLPMQFKLYKKNILSGVEGNGDWEKSDLIITARVCPADSVKFPCTDEESVYMSRGIAKHVKVPGTEDNFARTAASLPLQ